MSAACLALWAQGAVAQDRAGHSGVPGLEERIWLSDDEAIPELEREAVRLVQEAPESPYYHFLLSHAYLRKFASDQQDVESLRTASELATQALELDPNQEYGYVAMAEVLDVLGQNVKALAVLREGTEHSKGWRLTFSRSRIGADRTSAEDTIKALTEALKHPDCLQRVVAPYLVIAARARAASPYATLRTLEEWASAFPGAGFDEAIAAFQTERGNYENAHQIYQRLQRTHPGQKELMFSDAVISYRKLGMTQQAITTLKLIRQGLREDAMADRHGNKRLPAMIEAHLGAAYLRAGKLTDAHSSFIEALRLSVDRVTMIEFAYNEYKNQNADRQLVTLLKEIAEAGPGQGIVHAYMAEALSEKIGDQRAAEEAYRKAIVLEPTRSEYYNGLGLALYRQSDMVAALKEFSRATEIDPGDASARYNEACALALLGRKDEALYSLREAIQLEPRLSEQARVDKDFSSISKLTGFLELVASDFNGEDDPDIASATTASKSDE